MSHDSYLEYYLDPYIDSDGDIHYGYARPISTSLQTQQNDDARSKISDLEVHTVAHIADWCARAIDVTGNISSSTLSADNCVSNETAEWVSVNTSFSAIIARDVVDVDIALDVQKGTTVGAFSGESDSVTGSI